MAESIVHMTLVNAIVAWIDSETALARQLAILVASPSASASQCPPIVGGSIPDVYGRCGQNRIAVLGEAKTAGDIETNRSRRQYETYLKHLAAFDDATLVAAVPWYCVNQMRTLLNKIQIATGTFGVNIVVLDKLPG